MTPLWTSNILTGADAPRSWAIPPLSCKPWRIRSARYSPKSPSILPRASVSVRSKARYRSRLHRIDRGHFTRERAGACLVIIMATTTNKSKPCPSLLWRATTSHETWISRRRCWRTIIYRWLRNRKDWWRKRILSVNWAMKWMWMEGSRIQKTGRNATSMKILAAATKVRRSSSSQGSSPAHRLVRKWPSKRTRYLNLETCLKELRPKPRSKISVKSWYQKKVRTSNTASL